MSVFDILDKATQGTLRWRVTPKRKPESTRWFLPVQNSFVPCLITLNSPSFSIRTLSADQTALLHLFVSSSLLSSAREQLDRDEDSNSPPVSVSSLARPLLCHIHTQLGPLLPQTRISETHFWKNDFSSSSLPSILPSAFSTTGLFNAGCGPAPRFTTSTATSSASPLPAFVFAPVLNPT